MGYFYRCCEVQKSKAGKPHRVSRKIAIFAALLSFFCFFQDFI
jgi:hypothetical protein